MNQAATGPRSRLGRRPVDDGVFTIEALLLLPLLVIIVAGLLLVGSIVADALLVHEAARAGARAAATSTGAGAPTRAAQQAAPELGDMTVHVEPASRRTGDLVRVRIEVTRVVGPVTHQLAATAIARVEPGVGARP